MENNYFEGLSPDDILFNKLAYNEKVQKTIKINLSKKEVWHLRNLAHKYISGMSKLGICYQLRILSDKGKISSGKMCLLKNLVRKDVVATCESNQSWDGGMFPFDGSILGPLASKRWLKKQITKRNITRGWYLLLLIESLK